ncbi:MAG: MarR family winged helix-turn-helix transcriptional regulator [Caulobacteraceae bacterium]
MHSYIEVMDDLGPLACHCVAARQMTRHISKIYERHLGPLGVTATQLAILNFLARQSAMTTAEMAELMQMDRTTLLRAVKPLREKAWVNVDPQEDEPRRHVLTLSAGGRAKIVEARPLWETAQAEYEAEIGPEYARRLRGEFLNMTGVL